MLILDFTGIYENESFDFCKETDSRSLLFSEYISLKDISGTNCICDDFAKEEISRRLMDLPSKHRIRFFDNGNYHYMSRILMESVKEESFDLIVLDHHPDMKWTGYGEILSCGCWVLSALKDIPGLKNVYLIGADEKLMEEAYQDNPEIAGRVFYFRDFLSFKKKLDESESDMAKKVYISVDKDVLSEEELMTNWDQGDMTASELIDGLSFLKEKFGDDVIAVDVCGECIFDDPEAFSARGFTASNILNYKLINGFLKT